MMERIKNLKINKIYVLIAIAIAVVVLIIIGAVLLRGSKNRLPVNILPISNNRGAESPTGIYLEQKEYKMGEKIIGAIRNSENFDIAVTNIAVERLSLREWKTVKYDIGCRGCALGMPSVKCERTNIGVSAHNIYIFNWNQSTDNVDVSSGSSKEDEKPACLMVGAGIYRVKAEYYKDPKLPPGVISEQNIKQMMYSKEFIIRDSQQIMKIESPAFENNQLIPEKYTCQGNNVNPPLKISGVPKEAKSLALIVDDPDAPSGAWVHWTAWNIAPTTTEIAENSVPVGAREGATNFSKPGYGGPCPPSGTHRYFFKLYALDTPLDLTQSSTKADLERAMQGHILAQAELVGLYKKQ